MRCQNGSTATKPIVQDMVRGVNDDIQYNKREVQMLRQEKEQLEIRCEELETLYDTTKNELDVTQEALAKFQVTEIGPFCHICPSKTGASMSLVPPFPLSPFSASLRPC